MSDKLTRYRITGKPAGRPKEISDLIYDGWLEPDTMLQDIANAWRRDDKSSVRIHSERLAGLLDALVNDDRT